MRGAAGVIVTATATVVVASGIAMRLIDPDEYKNVWVGMWLDRLETILRKLGEAR